jgi:putative nucleotidyltransferase with HDIG domain
MLKAFEGPAADKKLTLDEWGVFLSGYAPVRNKAGEVVAILGVDNMAEDVYNMQREIRHRALFVLALGFLVSLAVGFLISSRITKPIKNLVELTRRIAAGDLHSRAELIGSDEIAELANSFNSMASSLYASRKRLHDYFYDVTQSLVRILEAKDHYTRGHSDRVADYSYKIALKMGLSQEKAELLKEAAEFHDIGKLGIQEGILNKKGKLTEEEWKIIQEHPVIGEDILRPVLLHEEMLAAIRSHHERFDGGGYPDKIAGDDINLFAQIVSVADAYDAMISPRAYRAAMKKEEAMAELKANSGTQFNPRAVETFLAILKEE